MTVARTRRRRGVRRRNCGGGGIWERDRGVRIRGEAVDVDEGGEEIVVGGKVVGGRRCRGGGERIREHEHRHVVGASSAVEGGGNGIRIWIRWRIRFVHRVVDFMVRCVMGRLFESQCVFLRRGGDNEWRLEMKLSLSLYQIGGTRLLTFYKNAIEF